MTRIIVALLIVSLAPGCATIRSRDLTPTADQPRIQGDNFYRGDDEALDEQEYYQLVGDKESYDAIRNPRGAAGKTDTNIVSKSDLELVNAWLKANPSMKFDDDGLDADEVPTSGKKKKGKKR